VEDLNTQNVGVSDLPISHDTYEIYYMLDCYIVEVGK